MSDSSVPEDSTATTNVGSFKKATTSRIVTCQGRRLDYVSEVDMTHRTADRQPFHAPSTSQLAPEVIHLGDFTDVQCRHSAPRCVGEWCCEFDGLCLLTNTIGMVVV